MSYWLENTTGCSRKRKDDGKQDDAKVAATQRFRFLMLVYVVRLHSDSNTFAFDVEKVAAPSFGEAVSIVNDLTVERESVHVHSNNPRTLGTFTEVDGSGNPFSTSHSLWADCNFV